MFNRDLDHGVVPVTNLREYFHDALQGALAHQHVAVEDQTEHYVVNLLTLFARSEQLYERTPDGVRIKPLVQMLAKRSRPPRSPSANAPCSGSATCRCSSPGSSPTASRAS